MIRKNKRGPYAKRMMIVQKSSNCVWIVSNRSSCKCPKSSPLLRVSFESCFIKKVFAAFFSTNRAKPKPPSAFPSENKGTVMIIFHMYRPTVHRPKTAADPSKLTTAWTASNHFCRSSRRTSDTLSVRRRPIRPAKPTRRRARRMLLNTQMPLYGCSLSSWSCSWSVSH